MFSPEFMGYAHKCYLDKIVEQIQKQTAQMASGSFQIDVPEDLSNNDLEYIKKTVEGWYNGNY